MPLTRLANTIIDGVAPNPEPIAEEIVKYLGSDLVCYRADTPEGLVRAQARSWDPILMWARETLGARLVLSEGVVFVAAAGACGGGGARRPFRPIRGGSAPSHVITTLTGSALLALAIAARRLDVEQAWAAAHVDEDWNMDFWGRDELAMQRRAARFADMQAACMVLALTS